MSEVTESFLKDQFSEEQKAWGLYYSVKYAIFSKYSELLGLYSVYSTKKQKYVEEELIAGIRNLLFLMLSAYYSKYHIFKQKGVVIIHEKLDKIVKEKQIVIVVDEIDKLMCEIPIALNIMGITDIIATPKNKIDSFTGF